MELSSSCQAADKTEAADGTDEYVSRLGAHPSSSSSRARRLNRSSPESVAAAPYPLMGTTPAVCAGRRQSLNKQLSTGAYDRCCLGFAHPLLKRLGADNVKFRASLCASQLIGLGILRYAIRSEPIASMKAEALADAMAPTLQRYLVGNIS
jgi:hypothetical protein